MPSTRSAERQKRFEMPEFISPFGERSFKAPFSIFFWHRRLPAHEDIESWAALEEPMPPPMSNLVGAEEVWRAIELSVTAALARRFADMERVLSLENRVGRIEAEVTKLSSLLIPAVESFQTLVVMLKESLEGIGRLLTGHRWDLVPISSLEPEPYEIRAPLVAIVTELDEGFEAGVFDVNVYASGDTRTEAVENLKALLLDYYDHLATTPEGQLGPEPVRQKRFLELHISKKA